MVSDAFGKGGTSKKTLTGCSGAGAATHCCPAWVEEEEVEEEAQASPEQRSSQVPHCDRPPSQGCRPTNQTSHYCGVDF